MKHLLMMIATTFAVAAASAQADTVVLKNGKKIAGKIVLAKTPDASPIALITATGKKVFTADEVQTLQFCSSTTAKKNGRLANSSNHHLPCDDAPMPPATSVQSYTRQTQDDDLTRKGKMAFLCRMCGGEGKLQIVGGRQNDRTEHNYTFTLAEGEAFFTHNAFLNEGTYKWEYHDTQKNTASGNFTIKTGEIKTITLFENQP